MTKEKIIQKNTGLTIEADTYLMQTETDYVLKSMQEYADQEVTKATESLKGEVERFKTQLIEVGNMCAKRTFPTEHELRETYEKIQQLLNN